MEHSFLAAQLKKPEGEAGKRVAENMNTSNSLINRHAIHHLHIGADDRVLEIGMGNGFFCKEVLLRHPSVTYTGCDFSELMIAEAIDLNREWIAQQRAGFHLCDAAALPFDENFFSKIFTVNTIYFWEAPWKELTEMYRVLQPGGKIVIALRTRESMLQLPFTAFGFHQLEKEDIAPLLQQAGFTHISLSEEAEPPYEMKGHEGLIQLQALYAIAHK